MSFLRSISSFKGSITDEVVSLFDGLDAGELFGLVVDELVNVFLLFGDDINEKINFLAPEFVLFVGVVFGRHICGVLFVGFGFLVLLIGNVGNELVDHQIDIII